MKKLTNKKGFTLMEMLIVVAIIVILVAISVPTFTNQLKKAREATDDANLRAAKAAVTAEYITADTPRDAGTYYYNIETGKIEVAKPAAYSQEPKGNVIAITYYEANTGKTPDAEWVVHTPAAP